MREYNVGAVYINDNVYAGETNIPLLKGNQGYSISRVVKTSGTGTPGSYDTYTIYINTNPESIVGTFQVWNGTGNIGDMTKAEYDTDNDGIVDNAERVNNHTVDIDVPSNAKFTDTIYDDTAITNRVTTLENAGYITKSVSDLVNYYLKTDTYTKTEVNTLVDTIPKFAIEVVNSLPTQDISTTTIYLVRDDSQTGDIYQEYIYVNNTWELLGAQRIDLSNYYTKSETYNKTEIDTVIGNKISNTYGTSESIGYSQKYQNAHNVIVSADIPTTSERVWFKKGINLVDKSTILKMTTINSTTGLPESTSNFSFATQLIKVKPNTDYYVKAGPVVIYAYDTNKSFMSIIKNNAQAGTFNTGTAEYIRGRNWWANNTNEMNTQINNAFIYEGSTDTTYEPYITPSINVDGDEIYSTNYNNYSTDEIVVGKFLGKPLYRKVITINKADITAQTVSVAHGISNIGVVVRKDFIWERSNIQFRDLPAVYFGGNNWGGQMYLTATEITFELGTTLQEQINQNALYCYVIIEYTKTTD